jgi:hypothetical protein
MLHALEKIEMNNAMESLVAALRNENGNKECEGKKSHELFVDSFFGFPAYCIFSKEINLMSCIPF